MDSHSHYPEVKASWPFTPPKMNMCVCVAGVLIERFILSGKDTIILGNPLLY